LPPNFISSAIFPIHKTVRAQLRSSAYGGLTADKITEIRRQPAPEQQDARQAATVIIAWSTRHHVCAQLKNAFSTSTKVHHLHRNELVLTTSADFRTQKRDWDIAMPSASVSQQNPPSLAGF